MKSLFDPSLYQFDQPQPSYWEASAGDVTLQGKPLAGAQSCDVAIIGGGYTGLSAALHLARDFNVDVAVLEAGHIGWGASGRNGGFCTMGATKLSLKSQIGRFGIEQTRHFYQSQADAVNLVHSIGKDEDIDFLAQGDGEFMVAESPAHFADLQQAAEIERRLLGLKVDMHSHEEFAEIGYDAPHQHGAACHQKIYCQSIYPLSCMDVHPDSRLLFCVANIFALVWVFIDCGIFLISNNRANGDVVLTRPHGLC